MLQTLVIIFLQLLINQTRAQCSQSNNNMGLENMLVSLQDLRYAVTYHFCSGFIVQDKWVLTTGHCVEAYKPEYIKVVKFENVTILCETADENENEIEGNYHEVVKIIIHEKFDNFERLNDIALLKTSEKLSQNLADGNIKANIGFGNEFVEYECLMIGYNGQLYKPDFPLITMRKMRVISNFMCYSHYFDLIFNSMVCAVEKNTPDFCEEYLGNALICEEKKIVGLASWSNNCGLKGYPFVFTNVENYLGWIQDIILLE